MYILYTHTVTHTQKWKHKQRPAQAKSKREGCYELSVICFTLPKAPDSGEVDGIGSAVWKTYEESFPEPYL